MIKQNCRKPKLTLKINNLQIEHSDQEKMDTSLSSSGIEFDDYYEQFKIGDEPVAEVSTNKCGRIFMEDRFCALPVIDDYTKQFFFAVFDGHGGSFVSRMVSKQLHSVIKSNKHFRTDLELAIKESFTELNSQILSIQSNKNRRGGSTALCAMNLESELYVVNLGDSSCYVVNSEFQVCKLTNEHRPSYQNEADRINKQQGLIIVKNSVARIDGELAVSRSFGDLNFINSGLIAEPEIHKISITANDLYLILATDGFWDVYIIEQQVYLVDNRKRTINSVEILVFQPQEQQKCRKSYFVLSQLCDDKINKFQERQYYFTNS